MELGAEVGAGKAGQVLPWSFQKELGVAGMLILDVSSRL